ncbi:MAG: tRNA methyltransferase [Rhodospirillaceae bacterium]|nr:tRNA methyltransferase [Rhodospirillaceae bacterium]|tara:strand:- start:2388 stop:2846 length:459 start_codon:yes stop_codon:yes gene_type:complete
MINIVSFQPDIPQNLGGLIRLTSCLGAKLSIIEPCGFPLGDKGLRRVSMDYLEESNITIFKSWKNFIENQNYNSRRVLLTTKSTNNYSKFTFKSDDYLILGSESSGVPEFVLYDVNFTVKIPMNKNARSLNIVSAASIVLAEAMRQNEYFNH